MPLKPGKSKKVISENISEFHKGPTFAKTEAKFGKKRADKQAVAVAFSNARKTGRGQDSPAEEKRETAHEKKEVKLLNQMKSMHKGIGTGQSKKVGCGHASCKVGKGCSMGKGQAKKIGKGSGAPPGMTKLSEPEEDSIYGESAPDETGKTVNKYGATVRRAGDTSRDDYRLRVPLSTFGTGQGRKRVGKGQSSSDSKKAGGKMPPRKPKGAMPLPGAQRPRGRHPHRPPGQGAPQPGMAPPPGGMPMGGGPPMGPPMLPGAGAGGTPGLPPAPMGGPPMMPPKRPMI